MIMEKVPSIQQISFKLTENQFPSFSNSKGLIIPNQSSLEYTNSNASIHQLLNQEYKKQQKIQEAFEGKNSALQSTSAYRTTISQLKNATKYRFRQITIPSRRINENTMIDQRLSLHVLSIGTKYPSLVSKTQSCKGRNHKSQRKKSISGRQNMFSRPKPKPKTQQIYFSQFHNDCKMLEDKNIFNMGDSMLIKPIFLRQKEQKQKAYFKRVIQNRNIVIHQNDNSKRHFLWTSRKMRQHL